MLILFAASNLEKECGKQKSIIRQLSARVESMAKKEADVLQKSTASELIALCVITLRFVSR